MWGRGFPFQVNYELGEGKRPFSIDHLKVLLLLQRCSGQSGHLQIAL